MLQHQKTSKTADFTVGAICMFPIIQHYHACKEHARNFPIPTAGTGAVSSLNTDWARVSSGCAGENIVESKFFFFFLLKYEPHRRQDFIFKYFPPFLGMDEAPEAP